MKKIYTVDDVCENKVPSTKHRYIGLEIEFFAPWEFSNLAQELADSDIAEYCTLTTDGSIEIPYDELEDQGGSDPWGWNDFELKVLCKQMELPRVMRLVSRFLRKFKARVNESCGLHVHLDMRDRDPDTAFQRLKNAQVALFAAGGSQRMHSGYARPVKFLLGRDITNHYSAINAGDALERHNTIEVRIHEATLSGTRIVRWVDLLISVMRASRLTAPVRTLAELKSVVNLPEHVLSYLERKHLQLVNKAELYEELLETLNAA